MFFFGGEPIPPGPGALAYLAVRLRGKAEKKTDKPLAQSEEEEEEEEQQQQQQAGELSNP